MDRSGQVVKVSTVSCGTGNHIITIVIDCYTKENLSLLRLDHYLVNDVFQKESSHFLCINYVTSVTSTKMITEWPHSFK